MKCIGSYTLLALLAITSPIAKAAGPAALDKNRIDELAKMLPASPRGVGPTIADRKAWEKVAAATEFKGVVANAEKLLDRPIPELTDELFLDFSRTGNRTRCQRVLSQRQGRYPALVLAECIENRGRFLPAIEESIRACCSDKTWVMPAHDRSLRNFKGSTIEIDLRVANEAWNLATVHYWLGDKLSPEVRKLIRDQLERRTFTPFEGMVTTGKPRMWWLTGTNNWNAVCLAGVTGSALAMIESPRRRAMFIAAAERYVQNFLRGFTPDGYCSEGVGYWNYGFGHYTMLAETVYQATGGKADMFTDPRAKQDAWFGPRMEILPGIYPAFADCSPGARPSPPLVAFLSRRLGFGLVDVERQWLGLRIGPQGRLFELGIYAFDNSATPIAPAEVVSVSQSLRTWFGDAGVLIARPAPGGKHALGVALKGGHNAEHHNHNDVGTYMVALGDKTPLVDPGAEVYTGRTFSSRRYDSGVLNSLGHPVPLAAGKLQRTGRSAAGKVLKTEFTEEADTVVFDIRSAYDVKELKKLVRTFVFSRKGQGSLTVTDEVEFDSPQTFGTALITFDDWKRPAENRLLIGDGEDKVVVEIDTGGAAFELKPVEIKEDVRSRRLPKRLGIDLAEPVTTATVRLTIAPATP